MASLAVSVMFPANRVIIIYPAQYVIPNTFNQRLVLYALLAMTLIA